MQLNCRVKRCEVKNQNRRQKVLNRGFKFSQGDLTFWKFDKIFTDLQFFIFKFGRAELTNAHRSDWTGLNFAYGVVATSPVVLRWLCDSPRTGCAWRTTPYIYVARTSHNRVIMACELYCCLLPQCAYAARDFRSQQNSAVTRMWRSCGVQPSHKECAIGAVRCKKEGMLLQPLWWCCADCVIHHERDVREEQHHTYAGWLKKMRTHILFDKKPIF